MDHSLAYKKALLILETDGVDKHLAVCYLDIDKQLDECRAVSDSRLNSYLAQIEATKVALDKVAELEGELGWASKCVQKLEKENESILDVLCTITFFAETTGGTAGRDPKLCEATQLAKDKLFPKPQRKEGGDPCGECHLKEGEICCICGASDTLLDEGE